MVYAETTLVILYWKLDQTFIIHISHHVWFDEYNSRLYISYKHTPGSLLLRQYPESHIHYSDLLILIPCKIDLTYTPLCDATIINYEIDLSTSSIVFP